MDSNALNNAALLPECDGLEIDKIPGAWVLTYWLPDGVTLRLKIRHTSSVDPDNFVAEVRVERDQEFRQVHKFWMSVYELAHPDKCPDLWNEMPNVWSREFAVMAQVWARLTFVAEFGASVRERYAAEPHSSLDHFDSMRTVTDKESEENPCETLLD
jgi:hypothetical protein